jgi:hypothetical protein
MQYYDDSNYKGYYIVDGQKIASKTAAIYESWRLNKPIKWVYHDSVWDSFYNSFQCLSLGKKSLKSLYKERAQQLRDKYDYLILHYSGGADSHNILMTFLNNGIKLDEVFNRRHESVESKLYTPNSTNTKPENFLSEWDYAALPTLKWLAVHHPEIKLTTSNMFDTPIEKVLNDDTFASSAHWHTLINVYRTFASSPTETSVSIRGKSIANIIGNDKPVIYKTGDSCYMTFSDGGMAVVPNYASNKESFYWTTDLPALPFEQAYHVYNYFRVHKEHQWVIEANIMKSHHQEASNLREDIIKRVIYKDTWDFRFQVKRKDLIQEDTNYLIPDKDRWFLNDPEFKKMYDRWLYYYKGYDINHNNQITPSYYVNKSYLLGKL